MGLSGKQSALVGVPTMTVAIVGSITVSGLIMAGFLLAFLDISPLILGAVLVVVLAMDSLIVYWLVKPVETRIGLPTHDRPGEAVDELMATLGYHRALEEYAKRTYRPRQAYGFLTPDIILKLDTDPAVLVAPIHVGQMVKKSLAAGGDTL